MQHWHEFGLKHGAAGLSGRERVDPPERLRPFIDERLALLGAPLSGIRTGPALRPGLFPLSATGASTAPVTDAALAFLDALSPAERSRACFALDADEWRKWINIHINLFRHGVMLESLSEAQRGLALALMRATLSERGFGQARDIMRINGFLAELTKRTEEFGEWPYFISIFGTPSHDQPWGWQIDGHHLNLNCMVVDDHLSITPAFMGSEPTHIDDGPLAGTRVLGEEQSAGLSLMRALDTAQAEAACVRNSIQPGDLPAEMNHPFDGRMVAGALHDNVRVDSEGLSASGMSDAQRQLLLRLVGTYVGWTRDGHAGVTMRAVEQHLDETCFVWMGGSSDSDPFYYRVLSPVVLVEFDHHPGVVFDNPMPTHHHVHTLLRAPNGGDYGLDLLRQHHQRYDHSHGEHTPRDHG